VHSVFLRTAAIAAVLALAFAATAYSKPKPLVRSAANATLKAHVLVDRRGHTLYHLSVEKRGHFICTTSACLSFWHPLVVARAAAATGPRKLGTVRRPDGRLQVTYAGAPLYTFTGDKRAGQAQGEGFKDVGVWHAATTVVSRVRPTPTPTPTPTTPSYPYP
jgi:predicted lipoprotein with Yx(FWY)xxD motif